MSLIWIKVDKEKKTHSIYCDGMVIGSKEEIVTNDQQKIIEYNGGFYSVLLGCSGKPHSARFIMEYFGRMFAQRDIHYNLDGKKNVEWELIGLFEDINKNYASKYDTDLDGDVVLSINGHLFKMYDRCCGRWECVSTKDNFICCDSSFNYQSITMAASALLHYNNDIEPQDLLNTVSKVTNAVNTELIKIENVEYK